MITEKQQIKFRRFGILTIAAVFFLIFVGGLVRSTGSGLGCPDWPKCFGKWVPPTDVNQLPADYKTRFAIAGKEIADFDVFKTWTEYVNRLVGVAIGILVFLTIFYAAPYRKTAQSKIFWFSFLAFVLVGFEGWIGSKVVSTDLATYMITIHMLLALMIVALLIYTVTASQSFVLEQQHPDTFLPKLVMLALTVGMIQIVSGTQVRETIDEVALRFDNRALWKDQLGWLFTAHGSWSWADLLVSGWMSLRMRKSYGPDSLLAKAGLYLMLLMGVQALTGAILAQFEFPSQFQSIHLTLGSLSAGLQIFIAVLVFSKTKIKTENV